MNLLNLKINLLRYGVNFKPITLFNTIDSNKYKMKFLNKNPTKVNGKVFDLSNQKDLIPSEVLLTYKNNRSITKLRYNDKSPITISLLDNNQLRLIVDKNEVDAKCELVKIEEYLNKSIPEELTSKSAKIKDYVSIVGLNRVTILLFDGCYNWLVGENCKFCDLHPVRKSDNVIRPTINDLCCYASVDEWWDKQKDEYLKCLEYSLKRVLESMEEIPQLFFMAGNLKNSEQTWRIALDVIEYLSKSIDLKNYITYLNVAPHYDLKYLKRIKEMGIRYVQYNLELSTKKLFTEYCPGKLDYDLFYNKLIEATKIMGKGFVRSNFVLGLEDTDALIKFADEIGNKGVVVDYSIFQPKKGTLLFDHPVIDFDKILDFSNKLCKVYKKYNFKPIFTSISSRSSIMNELYWEM